MGEEEEEEEEAVSRAAMQPLMRLPVVRMLPMGLVMQSLPVAKRDCREGGGLWKRESRLITWDMLHVRRHRLRGAAWGGGEVTRLSCSILHHPWRQTRLCGVMDQTSPQCQGAVTPLLDSMDGLAVRIAARRSFC
jgi:hypothetical protein